MYVAPNGQVFVAGPNRFSRYLDTTGTGSWSLVDNNNFGNRHWGSSVMYDVGKVLITGGSQCGIYASCSMLPTNTAEVIDLNSPAPQWTYIAPMAFPRKHHNLTLLPDGKVLATGGTQGAEPANQNSANPALAAEIWDPETGGWTTMASLTVYRGYHSTALLLPDGRVFSAGGDFGGPSAEMFYPPYLFRGSRPTVTAAPANIGHGETFFVGTPDAANISKVTLIALSSVTHTVNVGQRFNRLSFSQASGGLNVTAPVNGNLCPPGYYMLFLVNDGGVPSIAQFIRVQPGQPSGPPAAPTGLLGTAISSNRIDLRWTDNSDNETQFLIERSNDGANFAQIAATGANVTAYSNTGLAANRTYHYRLRAANPDGSSGYSDPATATTPAPSLPRPTNLTAVAASGDRIDLTWKDNSSSETGFRVLRSVDGKTFVRIASVGANVTTYASTGLTPGTKYYYRVRAYTAIENSLFSNTASATTQPALPAPSGLNALAIRTNRIALTR
jgi:hypothetical protein